MDRKERERLVRRISSGITITPVDIDGEILYIRFNDPTLDIMVQADAIYSERYSNLVAAGGMTIETSFERLKELGTWSDEKEYELVKLRKDVEFLQTQLDYYKFQKMKLETCKKSIEDKKKRIDRLVSQKHSLMPNTAEYIAEMASKRYLIEQIIDPLYRGVLENQKLVNILIGKYFNELFISETTIRELARNDPWRLYWSLAKDTGSPLFKCPAVEITDNQYRLVLWSKIYDFAYESSNRPESDIINDDELFDNWYQQEQKRLEKESKEVSQNNNTAQGRYGHVASQEKYIPADKGGAAEVYALNNAGAKATIRQRQQAINKKGKVKEGQLPDVAMEMKMALNRQAIQKGTQK